MLIFLNGTSSVGKSSLARAIMRQSTKPLLYHASDHLLNFWIDKKFFTLYEDKSNLSEWQKPWFCRQLHRNHAGEQIVSLANGDDAIQLYRDIWHSCGYLIAKNYDMIIDEVVMSPDQLGWLLPYLNLQPTFMIKVTCEDAECERREIARQDRYPGLWRGLTPLVEQVIQDYDFVIDTTYITPNQAATQVLAAIEEQTPQALNKILTNYDA